MCPKRLSFWNIGECSQMFDETVNCVGDIFLYKYALFHMSYHSHNRKQSDKIKVKEISRLKSFGLFPLGAAEIIGLYRSN